jgi:hypothetical protein
MKVNWFVCGVLSVSVAGVVVLAVTGKLEAAAALGAIMMVVHAVLPQLAAKDGAQ